MEKARNEKICLFFLFLFLLFPLKAALSQNQGLGLGINNYHISLIAGLGETNTNGIGIFNPSPYEEDVKISVECYNCVSDVKIFGVKVAENREDIYQYVSLTKTEAKIPAFTTAAAGYPVTVSLSPRLFVTKYLRVFTPDAINFFLKMAIPSYSNYFDLPYPSLLLGEEQFHGGVAINVVSSTFGTIGVFPSVASTLELKVIGMPWGSFILLLLALIVAVLLVLRKKGVLKKIHLRKPKMEMKIA